MKWLDNISLLYKKLSTIIAYYVFCEKQKLPSYLLLHLLLHWDSSFYHFALKWFNYRNVKLLRWGNYCEFKLTVFQFTASRFSCISLSILAFNLSLHLSVVPLEWENFVRFWMIDTVPNGPFFFLQWNVVCEILFPI